MTAPRATPAAPPGEAASRANPYVGARPLTREQSVFGRDRERREIVDLLIAERIVLLHAPSGAGKTSLIQGRGGVADTLRDEGFAVLPSARVCLRCSVQSNQNRYVESLLTSLELEANGGAPLDSAMQSLVTRHADALGVVLIVDQFEEVLTVDPTDEGARLGFFQALGHALENRRLWALFAVRDEYVGPLAPYRSHVPTHLRASYHLDLLAPDAARQAIVQPARGAGVPFTDGAAEKLIQELCMMTVPCPDGTAERRSGPCVEPVQLQVVCHRLWRRRPASSTEITEQDVSGVDSVDAALSDHYAAAVEEAARGSGESERTIREWIEHDLITESGVRGQVMRYGGRERRVGDEAVRRLIDAYLLRLDTRRGVDWLELAHDRLIRPIRQNNIAWRREHLSMPQKHAALWEERGRNDDLCLRGTALEEAERWATSHRGDLTAVEEQFLDASRSLHRAERAAKMRQRAWLSIAVAVAVIMTSLVFYAWSEKRRAEYEQENERAARLMADARELLARNEVAVGMKLLLRVTTTAKGWVDLANELLNSGAPFVTFTGEGGHQSFASFSPDGTKIAVSTGGNTVAVWKADGTGKPIVLSRQEGELTAAAFSPDGTKIVTASLDNAVRVWNADGSGAPIVFKGHTDRIQSVAFSPDGTRVVSASDDSTARVWNVDGTGTPIILRGHAARVISAAFDAEGRRVVTGSWDKTARVWNADGSGMPVILEGHTKRIQSVKFSPDGKKVATGSWDTTARVWNADGSGTPVVLKGHERPVQSVAFNPDGTRIATASLDWTARVWNVDGSGEPIVLQGHRASVLSIAYSPNGRSIVTGSVDHTARVWSLDSIYEPIVLRGHQSSVGSAVFSPDGSRILTGSDDDTVRVWNAHGSGEPVADIHGTVGSPGAFSADFKSMLVQGSWDGTARVRSIDGSRDTIVLRGHEGRVRTASFSPDGKTIVTASDDHTARVWDTSDGRELFVLRGHDRGVLSAAYSPDGMRIVTASADRTARVWSADGKGTLLVLRGHDDRVINAVFSPDSRKILTGSDDSTARLWDASSGRELFALRGHANSVQALAFSVDGQRIVTGAYDNTARIWRADDGREVKVLRRHEGPVRAAAFSSAGDLVVTGSDDCTARVWSIADIEHPVVLRGHAFPVDVVAFDTTGQRVITVSEENDLKVWNLSPSALKRDLEQANEDCLSPDEYATYLNETNSARAESRYARCERAHGRLPSEPPSP